MQLAKTVKEAELRGENKYYSGKPCPQGHTTGRYVFNNRCTKCHLDDNNRRNKQKRALKAKAA